MPLNHVLAADGLGSAPGDEQLARAFSVLRAFGFHHSGSTWTLDDTFDWVTISESEGRLHVHARSPLPAHLLDRVLAALDGLVTEVGLVRTDPISRGVISPATWMRMVAEETRRADGALR